MDHIAQLLLDRALADPNVQLPVIASIYCPPMIVALLDDAATVRLATTYFAQLEWLATQLKTLWKPRWRTGIMVMRKGDNSSRWNAAARAWDQMRTGWLNVQVFQRLPLPWDVVLGTNKCTAAQVRNACVAVGIDPDATG